jgi:hypothetical protein
LLVLAHQVKVTMVVTQMPLVKVLEAAAVLVQSVELLLVV